MPPHCCLRHPQATSCSHSSSPRLILLHALKSSTLKLGLTIPSCGNLDQLTFGFRRALLLRCPPTILASPIRISLNRLTMLRLKLVHLPCLCCKVWHGVFFLACDYPSAVCEYRIYPHVGLWLFFTCLVKQTKMKNNIKS